MNITRYSEHVYVPNQLFGRKEAGQQVEYLQQKKINREIRKGNISYSSSAANNLLRQQSLFRDVTNETARKEQQREVQAEEKFQIMQIFSIKQKQLQMKTNFLSQTNKQPTEQNFKQNTSLTLSKLRTKKKVSPKKNNLRKLFEQIEDEQNNEKQNKQKKNNDKNKLNQPIKQISDNNTNVQQNFKQLGQQSYQNEQKCQEIEIPNIKMNKFHFLHNQLNLDTSSEEQDAGKQNSIQRSNSSQNSDEKICFQIPKIRNRNNFFLKDEDFQDDSFDSEDHYKNKQHSINRQQNNSDFIKQQDFLNNKNQIKKEQQKSHEQNNPSPETSNLFSKTISISDLLRYHIQPSQEYLKKSLPVHISIQIIVKRDRSKKNSQNIEYLLYDAKSLKQILIIKKISSTYQIHAKQNIQNPKAHPDLKYLSAKIQTNFFGNQFGLKYVCCDKPNTKKQSFQSKEEQIAATITYQTNILGLNGPRKMNIYIPVNDRTKYYGDKSLQILYEKRCQHKIQKYVNKQAKWNSSVKSYVLNLKGKAKLSSVKNFVIVKSEEQKTKQIQSIDTKIQSNYSEFRNNDQVQLTKSKLNSKVIEQKSYVVFGKASKDLFNLVVTGPFSILQGLSVALSTFERKLTCE